MSQASFIELPIGIAPPQVLYWPVTPAPMPAGVPTLDLTSITGVTYTVHCRDTGFTATWTGGIYSAVPSLLVMTYPFTGSDFPSIGYYVVRPSLALVGGAGSVDCVEGVILVSARN